MTVGNLWDSREMKIKFRQCFREHSLGQHELQDCVFEEN